MPISATDVRYLAEIEPAAIKTMAGPLCAAYGVGLTAFGCKGNLVHSSGYHRSYNWIVDSPDSRYRLDDYSVRQSLDTSGDRNVCSAFDFVPGPWGTADNRQRMREITGRVLAAAKARDPRLAALREFAGTLDGRNVVTFNCADGGLKSPFDSSHLDHVHGSFWRSRAGRDHGGIVEIMLGDEMAWDLTTDKNFATEIQRVRALLAMLDPITTPYGAENNELARTLRRIEEQVAAGPALALTDAQLDALAGKVAALLGPQLRQIVDEELDEQSRAGADADPPGS